MVSDTVHRSGVMKDLTLCLQAISGRNHASRYPCTGQRNFDYCQLDFQFHGRNGNSK